MSEKPAKFRLLPAAVRRKKTFISTRLFARPHRSALAQLRLARPNEPRKDEIGQEGRGKCRIYIAISKRVRVCVPVCVRVCVRVCVCVAPSLEETETLSHAREALRGADAIVWPVRLCHNMVHRFIFHCSSSPVLLRLSYSAPH